MYIYGAEEWPGRPGFNPRSRHTKDKKWYLMPPCLTLSIIRYGSRVKLSNPGKGVAPSSTPWCSSYRKGSLRVTLDYGRQLYLLFTIYVSDSIFGFFVPHFSLLGFLLVYEGCKGITEEKKKEGQDIF